METGTWYTQTRDQSDLASQFMLVTWGVVDWFTLRKQVAFEGTCLCILMTGFCVMSENWFLNSFISPLTTRCAVNWCTLSGHELGICALLHFHKVCTLLELKNEL